jgi:type II secretory ATPase GspE/PulE/Tfp pilus assembly ATPase PilB-like protein
MGGVQRIGSSGEALEQPSSVEHNPDGKVEKSGQEQGTSPLCDLSFSDMYVELNSRVAWYKRTPDDHEGTRLSGSSLEEVYQLIKHIRSKENHADFRVEWRGLILRGFTMRTLSDDVVVLRREVDEPLEFDAIGYPERLRESLLSPSFNKGGLVLIGGGTAAGKTTSLIAWLLARLRLFGGTAITVENPVEIKIEGRHEGPKGVVGTCYQIPVADDREFGPVLTRILRAAPNLIMIGELRTAEAVGKAVIASASGHLVCATVHSNDVITMIARVINLVKDAGYDVAMLADSLCAVVHQSMSLDSDGKDFRRKISVSPLIVTGASTAAQTRAILRSGNCSQLISEIERQERLVHASRATGVI